MTPSSTLRHAFDRFFMLLVLAVLIAVFGMSTENFFSLSSLSIILNQLPPLIVAAVGMTLVLVVGGIDLSVGSVMALSGAAIGLLSVHMGLPIWLGASIGVVAGLGCGLLNGVLSGGLGLPSFIVTLGALEAFRGLAYALSNSQTLYIGPSIQPLSLPVPGLGLSPALLIALGLTYLAHFALTNCVVGRQLIATGANEEAARISGVRTKYLRIGVFAIAGLLAGLAGLFNVSYLAAADPNAGLGLELSAIAAAVIGGTSLAGGRGSVLGTFIGVLIIAVLQSGLAQLGVDEPMKRVTTGVVIVVAVLFDLLRRKRASN